VRKQAGDFFSGFQSDGLYMIPMNTPTAAVLIIGNEILSGRTQESNLQPIASRLQSLGIRLAETRIVPDETTVLIAALNALRTSYDYVFTTGGLGPTHDDITAACVAEAFGCALVLDPAAHALLSAYYGDQLNPARLRMAYLPIGATLIANPVSAAPGFRLGNVFVMAGVPEIMRAMLADCTARLQGGAAYHSRTIRCLVPESVLAAALGAIAANFPTCEIGSYPWFRSGQFGLALVLRGTDQRALEAAGAAVLTLAQQHDPAARLEPTAAFHQP
jgi:molybdenum cofactor synthesis domain-containing protein